MFDIGLQEMVVIGVLALLVFGPSKLPELGRMVGRALREFRRASDEFRSTVETNLHINDPDPAPAPSYRDTLPTESTASPLPSETEPVAPETSDTSVAVATETDTVEHGEPYCAQRGSRLFHRRECAWAARIPEPERIYMKTVAEAREQSLSTCPVCEPWEPA
jgi:TatA/E family protein of Tat protein translocase